MKCLNNLGLLFLLVFVIQTNTFSHNKYFISAKPPKVFAPTFFWITTDDSNRNIIQWIDNSNRKISYYNIYKLEENFNHSWTLIGTVNKLESYFFVDRTTNQSTSKYKVIAMDFCDKSNSANNVRSSLHLILDKSIDGTNHLRWNDIIGLDINKYIVFYGNSKENLNILESTNSDFYNDSTNKNQNLYYRLETSCIFTDTLFDDSVVKKEIIIKSNTIATFYNSAVYYYTNTLLKIYPNPLINDAFVEFPYNPNEKYDLVITDLLGTEIYKQKDFISGMSIKRSNICSGWYIVNISGNRNFYQKLLIGGSK